MLLLEIEHKVRCAGSGVTADGECTKVRSSACVRDDQSGRSHQKYEQTTAMLGDQPTRHSDSPLERPSCKKRRDTALADMAITIDARQPVHPQAPRIGAECRAHVISDTPCMKEVRCEWRPDRRDLKISSRKLGIDRPII